MQLVVATIDGDLVVRDVPGKCTAEELQLMLVESYKDKAPNLPDAEHQVLVFNGQRLTARSERLDSHGVHDGATLVLVSKRQAPPKKQRLTEPRPTLPQVEALVTAEAERRGRTVERAPPAATGPLGRTVEQQLQQLMQALQGISRGDPTLLQQMGLANAISGSLVGDDDEDDAPEAAAPAPDEAHLASLQDMGFSQAAARRALLLNRNQLEHSVNWLLAHADDDNLEEEPTEDELRAAYRQARPRAFRARPAAAPAPAPAPQEVVDLLTNLGFSEPAVRDALHATGNDADQAANLLASHADGGAAGVAAPEQPAAAALADAGDGAGGAAAEQPVAAGHGASRRTDDAAARTMAMTQALQELVGSLEGLQGTGLEAVPPGVPGAGWPPPASLGGGALGWGGFVDGLGDAALPALWDREGGPDPAQISMAFADFLQDLRPNRLQREQMGEDDYENETDSEDDNSQDDDEDDDDEDDDEDDGDEDAFEDEDGDGDQYDEDVLNAMFGEDNALLDSSEAASHVGAPAHTASSPQGPSSEGRDPPVSDGAAAPASQRQQAGVAAAGPDVAVMTPDVRAAGPASHAVDMLDMED